MPQLPEGYRVVSVPGKQYRVPFKEGTRPASPEEAEELERRNASPGYQALDSSMALTGAAMLGGSAGLAAAGALPSAAGRLMASPTAWGAGRAAIGLAAGESVPEAAYEGLEQAGATKLAAMVPGAARMLKGRLLDWINRGRGAATPVPTGAPASVVRFPASPDEAAAAMRLPAGPPQWHGPRTPPELLHQAAQARAAEAAAVEAAPVAAAPMRAPLPSAPSSTLEQQLLETAKLSKGARKQLSQAQRLEARVVELKSRQGLSEAQIVAALKEGFGIREPGAAKTMVDMILRTHGLK